ncbi:MAG: aminoacyl-tRNA hydrolase [Candidatus Brennerbacteria bacterium RIFOXYC1_FULL_41_11]|uniref:Peptidyl-tRNA hydrolase n=1 Tax=Candidatus Brennerbacteria bacterium RIFOXYD1_FULL_41_16 TaxID=1797529 RepID=A0A1G1XLA4_9BACT|nr:MAG: aminoacyl-tRNA hydrolase [Candidatus Brennerbacteria bacterium RIFOXYC1_FULL_41_11]OGY40863.1 MAG: aminoacyl-tRNA hydrolase [Candidatus Brennerbacteria bacterium RIFOXYD1_FULL_41_16]
MNNQRIIIGLGNPGKTYKNTRHNIGGLFLNFLTTGTNWESNKKIKAEIIEEKNIVLAKPLVYMNESGQSVKKILESYRAKPEDALIIQDDSDLVFGKIKFTNKESSSAGHHGIESIESIFGKKKFCRIRIGIRPNDSKEKSETFVLKKFSKKDLELLEKDVFPKAKTILIDWLGI